MTLTYILEFCKARVPEFFAPQGTILDKRLLLLLLAGPDSQPHDSGPTICKNMLLGLTIGQDIQC